MENKTDKTSPVNPVTIGMVILAAAIIVLGIIHFTDRNPKNQVPMTELAKSPVRTDIAFINLDSLISGYEMAHDLRDDLQKKANDIQKDLEKKARVLDNDLKDLENRMKKGTITSYEANDVRNSLIKRDQDLQRFSQQKQQVMVEEEQVMVNKVMESIKAYVQRYNDEHRMNLILSTNAVTNNVLAYDSRYDITAIILEGLNKEYSQSAK